LRDLKFRIKSFTALGSSPSPERNNRIFSDRELEQIQRYGRALLSTTEFDGEVERCLNELMRAEATLQSQKSEMTGLYFQLQSRLARLRKTGELLPWEYGRDIGPSEYRQVLAEPLRANQRLGS
jgi:hypothetical protein